MQVCSTVICFLQVVCDRAHSAERLQQLSAIASRLLCRDAVRKSKPVQCDLSCRQLLCHGYRIAVALSGRNVVRTPKTLCVARSLCSSQASPFNLSFEGAIVLLFCFTRSSTVGLSAQSDCTSCPHQLQGYYAVSSAATSQSQCGTICPAGSSCPSYSALSATLCAPGSYASVNGMASCTAASDGYFAASAGSITPMACRYSIRFACFVFVRQRLLWESHFDRSPPGYFHTAAVTTAQGCDARRRTRA
jgi:hypothetical protein